MLERAHRCYNILGQVMARCPSERVLLIRVENGGAIPAVGKDLFSSVAYEHFDALPAMRGEWQKQFCDQQYIEHLFFLAHHGSLALSTQVLPPGQIKDLYKADGVVKALWFKVHSHPGALYFLSLHFTQDYSPSAEFREMVRGAVNQLNRVFVEDRRDR